MSWDLLDIDGLERLQAERRAMTQAQGADIDMNRTPGRNYTQPFPLPQNERDYFGLDPWQRRALARRFAQQVTPRTNKAGLADHAPDLLSMTSAHDCHCGGKCGPCGGGKGLGFLNPSPPPQIDGNWGDEFINWFDDWFVPVEGPIGAPTYDPGAGGMLLQNDDCGRPPNHPSYGCECGSMWSDDYLLGCINPCLQGNQIEWRQVKDAQGNETFYEECKPTATQGELDCPAGTVKKGAYCIEPMTAQARTPVSRTGGGSGGSGGSGGGGSAGRQTPTNRGTPTTVSQNPSQAALAAALQQAAAICQRTGKVYDQQSRKCVSQNPFGVIQNTVGGLPVWEWALIAALGFIVVRKVSS